MARDIEEFLRRAAERRQQQMGGQPQQKPGPAKPPIEIIEPEVVQRPTAKRAPAANKTRQTLQQKRQEREIEDQRERDLRDESIEQHVGRHLDTSGISEHARKLGQGIVSLHDQVDSAIHQRLDHDLSKIDDLPTITDDARPEVVAQEAAPLAVELIQMLSTRKATQQAILIAEILNRRDFDAIDKID